MDHLVAAERRRGRGRRRAARYNPQLCSCLLTKTAIDCRDSLVGEITRKLHFRVASSYLTVRLLAMVPLVYTRAVANDVRVRVFTPQLFGVPDQVNLHLVFRGLPTGAIQNECSPSEYQLIKLARLRLSERVSTEHANTKQDRDREDASMAHVDRDTPFQGLDYWSVPICGGVCY